MRIHNMKITSEMDNKFFWFEKKINVHLIDCLCFYKSGYVIVCCICSALSCRLSAQFCPQLPHGCFACCWLNVSFIHIPLRSFVLQPLPACFITEQSTVKASLFVNYSLASIISGFILFCCCVLVRIFLIAFLSLTRG